MRLEYIDIHSHIHDKEFDNDRTEVLARMLEAGVGTIAVGTDLASSEKAVALAEKESLVYATVGVHPTDKKEEFSLDLYKKLAGSKKAVAVGECGLDYFRARGNIEEEKKRQKKLFMNQIEFALSADLPLMVHGRPSQGSMDAYLDILQIFNSYENEKRNLRGDIHFFAGDISIAKKFLDLGFTMSFTGVITFARDYDKVIRYISLDRIMAETDSPYVTPAPYRGKRNEPTYVIEVAKQIALIKGKDIGDIAPVLVKNTKKMFQI